VKSCEKLHNFYRQYLKCTEKLASFYGLSNLDRAIDVISEREDIRRKIEQLRQQISDSELANYRDLESMRAVMQKAKSIENEVMNFLTKDVREMAQDKAQTARRRIKTSHYQKNRRDRKQATAYDRKA